MKKAKTILLLGIFGLFAASCGDTTTDETYDEDTMTTTMPVTTPDTMSAMPADTTGMGDTTLTP